MAGEAGDEPGDPRGQKQRGDDQRRALYRQQPDPPGAGPTGSDGPHGGAFLSGPAVLTGRQVAGIPAARGRQPRVTRWCGQGRVGLGARHGGRRGGPKAHRGGHSDGRDEVQPGAREANNGVCTQQRRRSPTAASRCVRRSVTELDAAAAADVVAVVPTVAGVATTGTATGVLPGNLHGNLHVDHLLRGPADGPCATIVRV